MADSRLTTLVSDNEMEKSAAPSVDDSILGEKKKSIHGAEVENGELKEDGGEYPKAFAMVMIVVALSLSMFLVALDMTIVVCISSHSLSRRILKFRS